jgi:hypothetical protein
MGKRDIAVYKGRLHRAAGAIRSGTMLAVDPAFGTNSNIGWAMFQAGELVDSGEIALVRSDNPAYRLHQLSNDLKGLATYVDVLVVEQLRRRILHVHLFWAVGVCVAAVPSGFFLEMPCSVWQRHSKGLEGYHKGDQWDAVAIGYAAAEEAKILSVEE